MEVGGFVLQARTCCVCEVMTDYCSLLPNQSCFAYSQYHLTNLKRMQIVICESSYTPVCGLEI